MSIPLSIREQALRAICAKLSGGDTPATGGVFRSRLDQIDQSELPCFDVTPGDEKIASPGEYGDRGSVTRTLPVFVRAIIDAAVGSDDEQPVDDSALDPFYVFAVQQLAGGSANLDGVVLEVTEVDAKPVFQPNGKDLIGLEMEFEVKFATKRGDPAQKG